MVNKKPGIAVIGSGYWGRNLVRNYYDIGVLKLICDKSEALLENFAKQYPKVGVCLALHDVLNQSDIDAVVIATPAETHFSLASEALLAGKHVYVEKPLVLEEREAIQLINLAAERSLILMVGHLLQYHPVFIRLKEMVNNGELGRINYIYSNRLNLGKIRREENILWSFAPHDISMILALAGEFPESVLTTGGAYLHRKLSDVTTTHLEFPSGLKAHIFVSWLHPYKEQKLVVVGERKMAVFDDTRPWPDKLLIYPHQIRWEQNIPTPDKAEPERVNVSEAEPLRQECEHFLSCIETGTQPATDGREGLQVLRVLNAGQASLNENGRIVRMNKANAESAEVCKPSALTNGTDFYAHESAVIDEGVSIGAGTKIWHFSHILSGSRIGSACNVGQNVVIGPEVEIGCRVKIQNNVSVYKGVTLEDGVFCGPSMVFTNVYNPRAEIRKMDQVRSTRVEKGATIGANATILCGVTLGQYCFVGAGAVVTRSIAPHALVVGNPARRIGWVCECGERLDDSFQCPACGQEYQEDGGFVSLREQ